MKTLLFFFSTFLTSYIYSQNPALLSAPTANGNSYVAQIVSTPAGRTFFNTIDKSNQYTDLWGIYSTDGTTTEKLMLKDTGYSSKEATMLTPLGNDKIVFAGDNSPSGWGEVWVTDGTQNGTHALERFVNSIVTKPAVLEMVSTGSAVFYVVYNSDNHLQLRKTDGTKAGTLLVYDFGIKSKSLIKLLKNVNGIIYFDFYDVDNSGNDIIWRSDGTTAGTFMLKDLGNSTSGYRLVSYFMPAGSNIYFTTFSFSNNSTILFKTDGTAAGTVSVKEISVGSTVNSNIYPSFAAIGSVLYFSNNDGVHGYELWQTDGTAAGTVLTADISVGSPGSFPRNLTVFRNTLYLSANDGAHGYELWKYDGSTASMVKDINPGAASGNPSYIVASNNTLVFSANNSTDGVELWASDGTAGNTVEVANINSPTPISDGSSNPILLTPGNKVYFSGNYDINGDWKSDESCIFLYTSPDKIWTGNISSDWNTAGNWMPSGVPVITDNVLISALPVNNPTTGSVSVHSFYINGGVLNVSASNVISVNGGDFFNQGTINIGVGGYVSMTGIGTIGKQRFGSSGTFNGDFRQTGNSTIEVTANTVINGDYRFGSTTQLCYLGSSLTVNTVTNSSVSSFFVTDSYGELSIKNIGNNPVLFPVGPAASMYNPVTITNSGSTNDFGVRVQQGVYTGGYTGNPVSQEAVDRTWFIHPSGSGVNAAVTLTWNSADELPYFNHNQVYLGHYTSTGWDMGNQKTITGSSPYSITRTGITSFSPFAISSSQTILPIQLTNFMASLHNAGVQVMWQTTQEINTGYFNIERSTDGIHFTNIGLVYAKGSTSVGTDYTFTDETALTQNSDKLFYRLQTVDKDGTSRYSNISLVAINSSNKFSVFPNPAQTTVFVQGQNLSEVSISDYSGKKLISKMLSGINATSIDISGLPRGVYLIQMINKQGNKQTHKLAVQ